jgi:RNA polymerase sigma-70 factor (ECF subfamily)
MSATTEPSISLSSLFTEKVDTKHMSTALHTPTPDSQEDCEEYAWMRAIATGDQQALRTLIHKWQTPLFHFFFRALHQPQTAEDLTQMVFIRVYQSAPRYQPTARFSTWLFHIARKLLYNEFRRMKRKPSNALEDLPEIVQQHATSDCSRGLQEWEEWMQQALDQLPDRQKEVLLLHIQQGFSYEEISRITQNSMSTVKSLLYRSRQFLRDLLESHF